MSELKNTTDLNSIAFLDEAGSKKRRKLIEIFI